VPDGDNRGDAVALKAGEFEHHLAGDTVAIRSAARTYRFRIAPGSPRAHTAPELARTVSAIAGPRPR
jgi:hypothetical protein